MDDLQPEKGDCRDRTQGYVFRVHFEPLRQISIQKGVFRSVYIVNCQVRTSAKPHATLWTLGQREKSSEWTFQALESCDWCHPGDGTGYTRC